VAMQFRLTFLPHPSYVMRRPVSERAAYLRELSAAIAGQI
jgi:hypothetical protein